MLPDERGAQGIPMPSISLTDLVDIVSRSGTPKATKVKQVKARPAYSPATDFYRALRDQIADIHSNGRPKADLQLILPSLTDQKKITNYPAAILGYERWWGSKAITWFDPPRSPYSANGTDVTINPELGLEFGGKRYVIKLYFKADPLAKLSIDLITNLMEASLRPLCAAADVMAVLDVRRSKLFALAGPDPQTKSIADAELAYISALWPVV